MMQIDKELYQISSDHLKEYILERCGVMSFCKLQKLLFYCDAYHLAKYEFMLLHEYFIVVTNGVFKGVVNNYDKNIYNIHMFSDVSFKPFNEVHFRDEINKLTQIQTTLINEVLELLSKWSDMELEAVLSREQPFITAKNGHGVINKLESMNFYKSEIT